MNDMETASGRKTAGWVKKLYRYPVKSMGGEELEACSIGESGLRGDRVRVLVKEKSGEPLTARESPGLFAYRAQWLEDADESPEGNVKITSTNGLCKDWDDESFFRELETLAGETLAWLVYGADDALTGVDDAPLLIVTEESLHALSKLWRDEPELWRRFRPNVVIGLENGTAFEELQWQGRRFQLGHAVLEAVKDCERCSMVTIHPEKHSKDPSILTLIHEKWNGCFVIYARVVSQGSVCVGDRFIQHP